MPKTPDVSTRFPEEIPEIPHVGNKPLIEIPCTQNDDGGIFYVIGYDL